MRTSRIFRWAVLVAVLAAFAPAPASAQLGRFIKKKLQQKIAQAVIENVVPADTPAPAAAPGAQAPGAVQPSAPGAAKKAAPGRAVKGAAVAPAGAADGGQATSLFNYWVLEMTPTVLDNLEKGLIAEAAEKQANARVLARMRDTVAYEKCTKGVMSSPEGKRMMALLDAGDMQAYQQAAVAVGKVTDEKCGPPPSHYGTVKDQLLNKPSQAGEKASGFEYRQYYILKERALPFCSLAKPASGGEVKIPVKAEMFLVYSPAEVQALSGRCSRLLPALKAIQ